jgi:putative ABC transport system permease protein
LPDRGRPAVNDIVLRSGRLPQLGHGEEVVVSEAFAEAHGFPLGLEIGAIINGTWETLKIVGTALSPEYIYALGPGQLFPDDRRFGVLWVRRSVLGPAFDMEGAFNDVLLGLGRDAAVAPVIGQVDMILARYGGVGAIARKDQQSAFFIENELRQLRTFGVMVPILFLAVAAFLLNIVVGRIVARQREQIAAMKAVGYRDSEVGLHYAKLVGLVVAVGIAGGLGLASWLGANMTRMYLDIYRFPELPLELGMANVLAGIGITGGAAALGTWMAIVRTVRLPPAEAMRPEAPPAYHASLMERLGVTARLPPAIRMVVRELERRPRRAAMSVTGIAMATGLTVMNAFTFDSIHHLLNVQFGLSQREDVQITLFEPRAMGALSELMHLPGVMHAEPYRSVPVTLRAGSRMRNAAITGIPAGATLQAVVDVNLRDVPVPADGLVLSATLAESLAVQRGDMVTVEVDVGKRPVREVEVARVAATFVGLTAYMDLAALSRLLGEAESFNGAWLFVDEQHLDELHAAVKQTPIVAGVAARSSVLHNVQELLDENLGTWVAISLSFSLVMAFGVLYNAARITLAERAHELATLRVLGFRRREVGAILLGEIGALTAVAIPVGLLIGRGLAALMVNSPGFDNDQFRLPLVISDATYALAVGTVLTAAAVSAWNAWRRLDRIDIIDVLKARD